jgi:chromosome partitioning protein
MATCVVASTKGGAGKSTSVVSMAVAFASGGLSVAIIDGDPQQHSAMFIRQRAKNYDFSLDDKAMEWTHDGITVARNVTEDTMVDEIQRLSAANDIVLIDSQGSANQAMLMAMSQSNIIIIPCQASRFDVSGAIRTAQIAAQAAKMVGREIPVRLLLSRTPPAIRSNMIGQIAKEFTDAGYRFLRTELMDRPALQNMTVSGKVPSVVSDKPGERNAAENILALAKEVGLILQGKEPPLEPVEAGKGEAS